MFGPPRFTCIRRRKLQGRVIRPVAWVSSAFIFILVVPFGLFLPLVLPTAGGVLMLVPLLSERGYLNTQDALGSAHYSSAPPPRYADVMRQGSVQRLPTYDDVTRSSPSKKYGS